MLETATRLLSLLSLLQARREWTGAELADRLEVGVRTIRRDIDRLRTLGYPVHATPGSSGGYRLEAGARMPPLLLDDDEAIAVAVGLRTAATGNVTGMEETSVRALAKLETMLPPRLRRRVNALSSATVPLLGGGPAVDPETLTVIASACRDRATLRFTYRSHQGTASGRTVEPHGLVPTGRRWYLVAWDIKNRAWRTLRVDRIETRPSLGARFTPRDPPADDLAAYVTQAISSSPYRYQARVTLHAPIAKVAERIPPTVGALQVIDEHTCQLDAGGNHLEEIAIWIAVIGVDFEIHHPPELTDHVRELGQRFTRATAVPPEVSLEAPRTP
ncbi:MAG: YafY family transcriptional regulator [Actinomycetota bacterium]|nr:YafY family transcriptional regulator [Actinomycetota bacterium]